MVCNNHNEFIWSIRGKVHYESAGAVTKRRSGRSAPNAFNPQASEATLVCDYTKFRK